MRSRVCSDESLDLADVQLGGPPVVSVLVRERLPIAAGDVGFLRAVFDLVSSHRFLSTIQRRWTFVDVPYCILQGPPGLTAAQTGSPARATPSGHPCSCPTLA